MSRRVWPLVVAAFVLGGGDALAQERERPAPYPTATELAARMDSLSPLVEEARLALEARAERANDIDRVISASIAKVDTLHIGQLAVITPVEQAERARDIFERVWAEHFELLGRSPALENAVFVFQWDDERVPIHTDDSRIPLEYDAWVRPSVIEDDLRNAIGSAMNFDLGATASQIARWGGGNPLREHAMSDVYLQWTLTPSIVTRACLEGDVDACMSAMGLGLGGQLGSKDEPWGPLNRDATDFWQRFSLAQMRLWYTAEERQALIGSVGLMGGRFREIRDRCVSSGDINACDELLRDSFGNLVPAGRFERTSLLAHAIDLGGGDAWARVIEDPTMTPEQVLEHTAGMPIRDVVEGWQERMIAARPIAYGAIVPKGVLTLLWSLLFVALAMRSTRWRLR